MDRKCHGDKSPCLDFSDEEDALQAMGKGVNLFATQPSRTESREQYELNHPNIGQIVRQPRPAPPDHFQRALGFAKFLKDHTSPRNKRVTAGGRIVPVGPKSPPPTFQVEHIDTVLRTAGQNQALFVDTVKKHKEESAADCKGYNKIESSGTNVQESKQNSEPIVEEDPEMQNFGGLRIPKNFKLVEQLSPTTAIVKLGGTAFHASAKEPKGEVSFQTVTVGPLPQTGISAQSRNVSANAKKDDTTYKTFKDPRTPSHVPGLDEASQGLTMQSQFGGPLFPQSIETGSSTRALPTHYPTMPGYPGSHLNITGETCRERVMEHLTYSQAQPSNMSLNEAAPVVTEATWSIDILSALREATDAYTQASAYLKEHEKYTALNEMNMSVQEIQFAIEKKRYLILARDACRQKKDMLEDLQAAQLHQLRELETQQQYCQPQPLPQLLAYADNDMAMRSSADHNPASQSAGLQGQPSVSNDVAKTSSPLKHKSKKWLSPSAPAFVPAVETPTKKDSDKADLGKEGKQKDSKYVSHSAGVARKQKKSEVVEAIMIGKPGGSVTTEWIRKTLENQKKCSTPVKGNGRDGQTNITEQMGSRRKAEEDRLAKFKSTAQQASLDEKAKRRSRVSARSRSQDIGSQENHGLDLKPAVSKTAEYASKIEKLFSSVRSSTELSDISNSDIRIDSKTANRQISPYRERKGSPQPAEKLPVRFGIADALAAFENSMPGKLTTKSGREHTGSRSEAFPEPKKSALPTNIGTHEALRPSELRLSSRLSSKDLASQIEQRILQEKQRSQTSRIDAGNPIGQLFEEVPGATGARAESSQPYGTYQNSLVLKNYPPIAAPNFLGARILPGTGTKVGASHHIDHFSDAQHFSVPASAGAAASSLRSTLSPPDPTLRGGYIGHQAVRQANGHVYPAPLWNEPAQAFPGTNRPVTPGMQPPQAPHVSGARNTMLAPTPEKAPRSYHSSRPAPQFGPVDPSLLPTSVYRNPYRPYTPIPPATGPWAKYYDPRPYH